MHRVLLGACRHAAKNGSRRIDTVHVLMSVFVRVPTIGAMLDYPPASTYERPAPFADRAIDPDLAQLAWEEMREAHWRIFGLAGRGASHWDSEVHLAVTRALVEAASARRPWAGIDHLLRVFLSDPDCHAHKFLRTKRVDLEQLSRAADLTWPYGDRERPFYSISNFLEQSGILTDPDRPARPSSQHRWVRRLTSLIAQAGPALIGLEQQAMAEAVRLGQKVVGLRHLLLALLSLEEQMRLTGLRPAAGYEDANRMVLLDFHLTHRATLNHIRPLIHAADIAPRQRRRPWRSSRRHPRWTIPAARAADSARPRGGSTELLQAILTDEDSEARTILTALHADPAAILARL